MFLFLGPTDMATIFVIALLLFGPDQLPKIARQLGEAMRHMQNTTQSFMLEMDRAARESDIAPSPVEPPTDALSTSVAPSDEASYPEPRPPEEESPTT